jgi:hypothetical protein
VAPAAVVSVLFAPGFDGLSRAASADDIALWDRVHAHTSPTLGALLDEGHALDTIEALVVVGAIEASLPTALRA